MGRPERELDATAGPVQRFAVELRALRNNAGRPSYRQMSKVAGYSVTALSEAAGGDQLPSLPVALAYVRACGGNVDKWEERWRAVAAETAPAPGSSGETEVDQAAGGPCPYKGLAAFQATDGALFFGRAELVDQLTAMVADRRFVAVVGASGSGKSSVLRAGLAARAATDGLAGSTPMHVAIVTPGACPMRALGARTETTGGEELLVVDQFEEVFTLCQDTDERAEFIATLLQIATASTNRTRVVIGLRADFYGHCGRHSDLVQALNNGQLLVGPMTTEELIQAITRPARATGHIVETNLVARLIADAGGQSSVLPLISHALQETWKRRRGATLTVAGYDAAGGLDHAIARTAEDTYHTYTSAQQAIARQLFLRLTTPGEDLELASKRRLSRAELDTDNPDTIHVLDTLAACRLLVLDESTVELAHEALITSWPRLHDWLTTDRDGLRIHRELRDRAHTWDRHHRDPGSLYAGTELELARRWAAGHEDNLSVTENAFYRASIAQEKARLLATERQHRTRQRQLRIVSSLLVCALIAGVVAWQQRSVAVRQQHNAEASRKVALSRQLSAQATAAIQTNPDLASLLAVQAYRTAPTAEATEALGAAFRLPLKKRIVGRSGEVLKVAFSPDGSTLATAGSDGVDNLWSARSGQLVATLTGGVQNNGGVPLLDVGTPRFNPDGSTVAVSSYDSNTGMISVSLSDARTGKPIATLPEGRTVQGSAELAFSPDGSLLAVSLHRTVRLLNAHNGARLATFQSPNHDVSATAFSPDGSLLGTAGDERSAQLWSARTGRPIAIVASSNSRPVLDTVTGVAFDRSGETMATISGDRTVQLWNTRTGKPTAILRSSLGAVTAMAFDPAGGVIATTVAGNGGVQIWDSRNGKHLRDLAGTRGIAAIAFAPAGTSMAVVGNGLQLWNPRTWKPIAAFSGHAGYLHDVAFSPDGGTIATASADGTVRLWDPDGPEKLTPLTVQGNYSDMTVSRYGTLITQSRDGTVQIWDATGDRLIANVASGVESIGLSPDRATLMTYRHGTRIRLWDARSGNALATLSGLVTDLSGFAFSSDGKAFAANFADSGAALWDVKTGRRIMTLAGVSALTFSPDGKTLAVSSGSRTVRLWDVDTGKHLTDLGPAKAPIGLLCDISYSPNGKTLAVATGTTVDLWNTVTKRQISVHTQKHELDIHFAHIDFSRDGNFTTTTYTNTPIQVDGGVTTAMGAQLWDGETGNLIATLAADGTAALAQYSPDGRTIAVANTDNTVSLLDAHTGGLTATLSRHTAPIRNMTFNAGSTLLVTTSDDRTVRLWNLPTTKNVATFATPSPALTAAFSKDDANVVTRTADSVIHIWRTPPSADGQIQHICQAVGASLTNEEWSQYISDQPYEPGCRPA